MDYNKLGFGKTKKRSLNWQLKDSDNDGVLNTIDCDPYNKNKQGLLHNIGSAVAHKLGAKETAERIETRGKESDVQKEELRAYSREKVQEASKEIIEAKQQSRIDKQKAKIETKVQAIKDRPRLQAEARERLKQAVVNPSSKPYGGSKQTVKGSMNRNIGTETVSQLNTMMGSNNTPARNPMSEFSGIIVKKTNLPIGPLKNVAFAANSFVDFYENSGYVGRGTLSHDVYVKPWCRNSVFIKLLGGNRYCFINTEMEGCGVVCGKIGESCIIDGIQYNAGDYFNFHGCNDGGVLTPCNVQ